MPHDTREPGELFGPRFALFADLLVLGLATAVASLPVVTAPAAMSTACAVLDDRVRRDRPATAARYFGELRRRFGAGDLLAGAVAVAVALLLVFNGAVTRAGLPGAALVRPALLVVAGALAVVTLRACALRAAAGWRQAVREAAYDTVARPLAAFVLLLAVATAVVCAWAYPPLALLVPGPLALAARATGDRSWDNGQVSDGS